MGNRIIRHQDWGGRLGKYIEECREKPFRRGEHDCALFAANCINIMRDGGEDIGACFRVGYKTRRQAKELLCKLGFDNLEDVATAKLGEPYENVNLASRGDCVSIIGQERLALGIIDLSGRRAVTAGKRGLEFFEPRFWDRAWKV